MYDEVLFSMKNIFLIIKCLSLFLLKIQFSVCEEISKIDRTITLNFQFRRSLKLAKTEIQTHQIVWMVK